MQHCKIMRCYIYLALNCNEVRWSAIYSHKNRNEWKSLLLIPVSHYMHTFLSQMTEATMLRLGIWVYFSAWILWIHQLKLRFFFQISNLSKMLQLFTHLPKQILYSQIICCCKTRQSPHISLSYLHLTSSCWNKTESLSISSMTLNSLDTWLACLFRHVGFLKTNRDQVCCCTLLPPE